jgi:O-succinylbenzoate synthase
MAKAAVENALWDVEAKQKKLPLWKLLGGKRREIPCGVSIGIQDSIEQLLEKVETELAAGYRRIKIKVKPGWDLNVLERIRNRWPDILLSCDANSAYRLEDLEHLRRFDASSKPQSAWTSPSATRAMPPPRLKPEPAASSTSK